MERLFAITKEDFTIQTFRSGGKGGQNQNKVNSGVRIIHNASGAVGEARDSRDQLQNKRNAFKRCVNSDKFQTRLKVEITKYIKEPEKEENKERIRTYNFKDHRVTDHRLKESFNLENILNGELDELINKLVENARIPVDKP